MLLHYFIRLILQRFIQTFSSWSSYRIEYGLKDIVCCRFPFNQPGSDVAVSPAEPLQKHFVGQNKSALFTRNCRVISFETSCCPVTPFIDTSCREFSQCLPENQLLFRLTDLGLRGLLDREYNRIDYFADTRRLVGDIEVAMFGQLLDSGVKYRAFKLAKGRVGAHLIATQGHA